MKKFFISSFLWAFVIQLVFSQNDDHIEGGSFLRRVEYNLIKKGGEFNDTTCSNLYNLNSKSDVEKVMFEDINSPIEFFFNPSYRYMSEILSGFRIVRDSVNMSYILEVKRISNYNEAVREARIEAGKWRRDHLINLPEKILNSLPEEVVILLRDYNRNISVDQIYSEEFPKHLKVKTISLKISDQFAEHLQRQMIWFIGTFKARGVPLTIADGYSVTFRTIVGDEVWSLNVHEPQGDIVKLSNVCRQIITDVTNNQLDDLKYVFILRTLEEQ